MSLVTIAQVRTKSGAPVDLISDAEVQNNINEVEKEVLAHYSIYATPTKVVEIKDGHAVNDAVMNTPTDWIKVRKPYLWKLLTLKKEDTELDLEYITISPETGTFRITREEGSNYIFRYNHRMRIKYLSAFMERDTSITTENSTATTAGTSVAIAVDDESSFSVNDWILIEGLDGNIEAAQITATDTDEITVDQLVQTHEAESVITLLKTDESLIQYILYASAVAVANYAVGSSYTIATGYTYPEYSVQKGVPYPHWEKNLSYNDKRRKEAMSVIEAKLVAMS